MAGAAGLERASFSTFSSEKRTQTASSQRDTLIGVNQGFQDERENGNGPRVSQPLQSGDVRDPKLVPAAPSWLPSESCRMKPVDETWI